MVELKICLVIFACWQARTGVDPTPIPLGTGTVTFLLCHTGPCPSNSGSQRHSSFSPRNRGLARTRREDRSLTAFNLPPQELSCCLLHS
jgi:hypothetical protein